MKFPVMRRTYPTMRAAGVVLALLAVLGGPQAVAGPSAIELEIMQNARINLAEAIAIAEREVDGRVIEAELDEDDDMFFYKLEVLGEAGLSVVYLNPASGIVVGKRSPGLVTGAFRNDDRAKAQAVADAGISLANALQVAEQRTGGRAVEIEVERDDDRYLYEIKTIQPELEHDVEIDPDSGRIIDVDEDD